MINRCIGCYYHDIKENVCTHGSPIFIDDVCTDYQDSEFVMQIREDAIEEYRLALHKKYANNKYLYENNMEYWNLDMEEVDETAEQLKEQK